MRDITPEYQRCCSLNSEIGECYHAACARLGQPDSVMQILYVLCLEEEPCPIGLILRESGLSKQTVHSALHRLEAEGYLRLRPLDGKRKGVALTEAGRALAERTAQRMIAAEQAVFRSWVPEDRRAYLELTRRFLLDIREAFGTL